MNEGQVQKFYGLGFNRDETSFLYDFRKDFRLEFFITQSAVFEYFERDVFDGVIQDEPVSDGIEIVYLDKAGTVHFGRVGEIDEDYLPLLIVLDGEYYFHPHIHRIGNNTFMGRALLCYFNEESISNEDAKELWGAFPERPIVKMYAGYDWAIAEFGLSSEKTICIFRKHTLTRTIIMPAWNLDWFVLVDNGEPVAFIDVSIDQFAVTYLNEFDLVPEVHYLDEYENFPDNIVPLYDDGDTSAMALVTQHSNIHVGIWTEYVVTPDGVTVYEVERKSKKSRRN